MGIFTKLTLGAALLGGSTLALAHEEHKGEVSKTIIIKQVHGEPGKSHDHSAMIAKCAGAAPTVDVSGEGKDDDKVKRSRVIVCNKGMAGADVVKALENARERIATQDELPAESKAKALAAIDAAIARHRSAK